MNQKHQGARGAAIDEDRADSERAAFKKLSNGGLRVSVGARDDRGAGSFSAEPSWRDGLMIGSVLLGMLAIGTWLVFAGLI